MVRWRKPSCERRRLRYEKSWFFEAPDDSPRGHHGPDYADRGHFCYAGIAARKRLPDDPADRFSTYLLAYDDKAATDGSGDSGKPVKTGDDSKAALMLAISAVSLLVFIGLLPRRKMERK